MVYVSKRLIQIFLNKVYIFFKLNPSLPSSNQNFVSQSILKEKYTATNIKTFLYLHSWRWLSTPFFGIILFNNDTAF